MEHAPLVILGAGLAGLASAHAFGPGARVLEAQGQAGGLARSDRRGDRGQYLFDHTGHWLHLRHPHVRALVEGALGGRLLTVERRSAIWSKGVFTPYPFQANFAGLPAPVVKECLLGYVQARLAEARGDVTEQRHFGDYIQRHFGAGIARHFMIPYNTRLWGVAPEEITAEWCGRFVPQPGLEEVIDGALGTRAHQVGYNASFVYPEAEGIGALPAALATPIADRIRLDARVQAIDPGRHVVRYAGGEIRYDHLLSTLPLPALAGLLDPFDGQARAAAGRLRATRLRYLNVSIAHERALGGNHWVYVPEERWPFYRIGCFSNAVPYMAPAGESTLYVELSNRLGPEWTDARIEAALVDFFVQIGEARGPEALRFVEWREIPVAYVIFDHAYFQSTARVHAALEALGITSIGRYGRWIYNSMEDSLADGLDTGARLAASSGDTA